MSSYVSRLEPFAQSVQPQVHSLHALSRSCMVFLVSFFYYYENRRGEAGFMPTPLLEASFCELLREYPLLAGVLVEHRRGPMQVVVDPDSLNLPEFRETHWGVDFGTLRASGFAPSALPPGAATMGTYSQNSRRRPAKLAKVHIIRCRGNSGVVVFMGISHALVDGHAYGLAMRRWAEISAHMCGRACPEDALGPPLEFSRSILDAHMPRAGAVPGGLVTQAFARGGPSTRLLSCFSTRTQVRLFLLLGGSMAESSHFYHISARAIDEIRGLIKAHAEAGQRISTNDAVAGLLITAIAQCAGRSPADRAPGGRLPRRIRRALRRLFVRGPTEFEFMTAVDVRPRLPGLRSATHCSNAVLMSVAKLPLDGLLGGVTPDRLARAATAVRRVTDGFDAGYIRTYADALEREADSYLRPFVYSNGPPAFLAMTNHLRIPHYEIDFGWGVPAWANCVEHTMSSMAYINPPPPGEDGCVVHLMLAKGIHDCLQRVPFWSQRARFIR